MSSNIKVVVVGGGYAGVLAANRLTKRKDVSVTLVNPRAQFVERIRLHQLVAGSHTAVDDFRDVLAGEVRLVVDTAERIDAPGRRATLASGDTLAYDYLVYAVGSRSAESRVPGAAQHAYPVSTLEEARRLREALHAIPLTAPVTVVGAGPSGIETAAELAEQGWAVTLAAGDRLGPYLHARGRRSAAARLASLGVTVLEGDEGTVTEVTGEGVLFADGRALPSAVTIWTAGFGVPELAARSGLSTDALGRLLTDETLTSVDDPRIVAAGDSAAPSDLPLRMSCQAAFPLGAQAADTVRSQIDGERAAALNQLLAGQCISLGRGAGLVQPAGRDDVAVPVHIAGRPAAIVKELVCRSTVWQLATESRRPGSYAMHRIPGTPRRRQALEQKATTSV